MTSGFVDSNGIGIHYRIAGAGPEILVLINGVGDDLDGWANQVDDFVAAWTKVDLGFLGSFTIGFKFDFVTGGAR
jgi:hypothetical protein